MLPCFLICLYLNFFHYFVLSATLPDTELILSHVLFRHGARTTYRFYPTDPHKNSTFYPFGLGGLTNDGKMGEYKLGKYLKNEYNSFLGDTYFNELIEMRSTDTTRTKMSAQLVLAGMWPPNKQQKWHPRLNWQPIPVYFKTKQEEDLLSPSNCHYRTTVLKEQPSWPKIQEYFIEPFKETFDYIKNHSRFHVHNPHDALEFYFIVSTENEMNLTLPEWTRKIYPQPLINITTQVYNYWNYDQGVKRINMGYLLKKIIEDSLSRIKNALKPKKRKMFLYSGHESTLGYVLNALKLTEPHIPPYGSAILFDLRRDSSNNYYMQVFRHGDRTQDGSYPNDPYQNDTFYPVGVGQLTDAGKLREYNIGLYLRETYNDFLGSVYFPGVLAANSSFYPRCKASLQLVLAGLYPPANIQRWNNRLNWQPIPYDYLDLAQNMLFWSMFICPKFNTFTEEYRNSRTYKSIYEPYQGILNYLQVNSGITDTSYITLLLHSTLKSQEEWNLTLPAWTNSVWPEPITEITKLDWQQMYATEETRALGAGFLMSKIINDTKLTINDDSSVKDLKIYLYSGHDSNVAAVLSWLGTADLHIPQYGSFIIFEIHSILGIPFVRVIHQNYENNTPQVISIPNCGFYCPFNTFVRLYTRYTNRFDLCN